MAKLWKYLLGTILVIFVVAWQITLAAPSFFKEKNTGSDQTELEAMLSGVNSDTNSSREIYQLYGGQVRPIQANITTGPLYDIPYQDYFKDISIFGDFLGLLDGNLTPPQMNSTWRETYLDSIAATAPSAKGRMTETGRPHLLKPLLIDEPQF